MGEKGEVHAVMLPYLAFGHMIPFFELATALAKSGIHISFISTPRNIQRLPKVPPNLSKLIHMVSIHLPKLDSNPLPENAEATVDVPADKIDALTTAYDLMKEPIKHFIAQNSPPADWLIVDFLPHWAADIAQDLNIPLIGYTMFSGSSSVYFGSPEFLVGEGQKQFRSSPESMTSPPHWVDFPSNVAYTISEATGAQYGFYGQNATGASPSRRIARVLEASQAIAIRSCPEFEANYLNLYSKLLGKPVIPVGMLPPEKPSTESVKQEPWSSIFNWLNQQQPRSVVFVGFGSETKLSKEEIHEIAYGLELSALPFLWALRDNEDALPPGFCNRTAALGVVQVGWAPQREILGHPSIGGSFFHAGWGSIIEALQFGHVLVLLPLIIDQPLNARLLVEKELGIEVKRAEDGSFSGKDIANAIREAMLSDQLRARARLAADEIFGDRHLHQKYAERFAEYLKS